MDGSPELQIELKHFEDFRFMSDLLEPSHWVYELYFVLGFWNWDRLFLALWFSAPADDLYSEVNAEILRLPSPEYYQSSVGVGRSFWWLIGIVTVAWRRIEFVLRRPWFRLSLAERCSPCVLMVIDLWAVYWGLWR